MIVVPSCVTGISGYSGSGKTTLIEKALPELKRQGLYVGVLKHTHHNLLSPEAGAKDTDRFFKAGADFVFAHDDAQGFAQYRHSGADLLEALRNFPKGLDLIIVEGHKSSSISRLWLATGAAQVPGSGEISKTVLYRDDPEYLNLFLRHIHEELVRHRAERPLMSGLLIGGRSGRMGSPKGLLEIRGRTIMEQTYEILSAVSPRTLLLGAGELPAGLAAADRLPDISVVKGPLAGMLSAFRWNPRSAWLISSVDMPFMNEEAWQWVLSQRKPGIWAVMPRREGADTVEATGACYEPEIFDYAELLAQKGVSRLQSIAGHPKVIKPFIPRNLEQAWKNVNTPEDWKEILAVMG
ncbi:MAG: molybdopterin-guanine dinucleotide biosynthesis protein B [Thermodesulfovibrionales bacterium]